MDRIAGRTEGRSRFDRLSREQGAVLLADNEERLDRIVGCASRATSAVVEELDGRATVRVLDDTILEIVANTLALRESPPGPAAGGPHASPAGEPRRIAEGDLGGTAIVSERSACRTRKEAANHASVT